ncbi:unnamed protein product [Rotaria magnacalcarata]|uniref:Uncharacterized protein n=1 Tax=Rotaria magnacalcarata TaxID=392030 RepID=A0A816HG66_9BILA|nr:unnamed protein product [Rotaria magnacalcarata]CAF4291365.1 unnamed protein product [Rotaria magnacalcarata]CAF4459679.1 unnamed protein product [Rotaria magnacalcarata]
MSNRCVFPNLDRAITTTLPKYIELIVDLTGVNWKPDMFYTILRRTRKLNDIIILAYDRKSFKVSKPALKEMNRLQKIELEYLIQIRYIDWCLPQLVNIDKLLPAPSNQTETFTVDGDDAKRLKSKKSNLCTTLSLKTPESIIICENQEENFCGRHALRALSQNLHLFTDDYLINNAQNIAATDRARAKDLILGGCVALRDTFNIELIQILKLENNSCPMRTLILSNTQYIQAFLIQQRYHYYCIRQFRLTKDYSF